MPVIKEQKVKKSLTKQERDKLRYEQKKENIKAQRKERYQNKKAEQKNVAEQKVNVNTIFVSNPKYACVQKTLTNLKKYLRRGEEFPREKFKNFLLRQNANFWTAFKELLAINQSQKKLRLPLTLGTLQEWKSEKEVITEVIAKKKAISFNYYPLRQFRYQLNNNRLWFQGKEITEKEVNEWGKNVFRWKGSGESKDWIYLEVALEKNYQLRAYCQEKKGDDIYCYQSYFSYKKKNLVNISFYLHDEISKILAKKRKKKAAEGKDIPAVASPISQSLLKNLADTAWYN